MKIYDPYARIFIDYEVFKLMNLAEKMLNGRSRREEKCKKCQMFEQDYPYCCARLRCYNYSAFKPVKAEQHRGCGEMMRVCADIAFCGKVYWGDTIYYCEYCREMYNLPAVYNIKKS